MHSDPIIPGSQHCPGWPCHGGDFPDFDHFVEMNGIAASDVPDAFATWMNLLLEDGTATKSPIRGPFRVE